MNNDKKDIIVSGMRPTGRLHLGNYHGALKNWVTLQQQYKAYFFVADFHALTTAYDRTENIAQNGMDMVVDWLAAGLDPKECTIFIQSQVPEISELNLMLGMISPLGWLLRNPSYKEQLVEIFRKKYAGQEAAKRAQMQQNGETLAGKMGELSEQELAELSSFGFLGYPVLMATDILIHNAKFVPVGQDQVPHLEIARDIARRFNDIYGEEVLVEPKPLLTQTPKVVGLDGRKMSKSYGNTIELGEDAESVRKKVMSMFTDPEKLKANDPGNPENCVVFAFHKIYNPQSEKRCVECRAGALGCVQCKKDLFALMETEVKEFNARRSIYAGDPAQVAQIIKEHAPAARESAQNTLEKAKKAMRLII